MANPAAIDRPLRILHVAGARPNFMKIAPLMDAFRSEPVKQILVHTGQHYDESLSRVFFDQLRMPRPDFDLEVGSGSHAVQTARIMLAFEPVLLETRPDLVFVVGDVNSTVACSLVAAKVGIRVAHVEAGLRSSDWTMPEEINRVLTDRLSDLLFTTERSANQNLAREGIPADRVHFVGNVMIDTLIKHRQRAMALRMPERYEVPPGRFALATLHRPSNVDAAEPLGAIVDALARIAQSVPVLFPVHPRTALNLERFDMSPRLGAVRVVPPMGYLEFIGLAAEAAVVLTDSGGVQEETTVLGVSCLTLRQNTERPVTVSEGTNRLVPLETAAIAEAAEQTVAERPNGKPRRLPELWDGNAARRIAAVVLDRARSLDA